MARKQSDYLASLLGGDEPAAEPAPAQISDAPPPPPRGQVSTLLRRESALARVASGEVRQVTQLLLDPARVRIWPGNARLYRNLTEENCRELIDSIIAEGGQKVPAVVRRVEDDPDHDFEVIAGTRRHWSISWLRANSYPDMMFVAQVAVLDDEAAFRLADLENRARKDVSDLERARNYAQALRTHYGNHQSRMAERLKVSKGWLSKMLKVAAISDAVVSAFPSPDEIQLKPAYPLAQLVTEHPDAAMRIENAAHDLAIEQANARVQGHMLIPTPEVIRRLMDAGLEKAPAPVAQSTYWTNAKGRKLVSLQSVNRQGITLRLHSGSGASVEEMISTLRHALTQLEDEGRGLQS